MQEKRQFLQKEFLIILRSLSPDTKPNFGKMNVHQMIEHMEYAFRQAMGEYPQPRLQDEAATQKMYQFMMSDKPFRDNTPNPYLPAVPPAPLHPTTEDSIKALEQTIHQFFHYYDSNPDAAVDNPFFGRLQYPECLHLLHKHALHHIRQFSATTPM